MSQNNDRPCCQVLACASARDNEPKPIALKAGTAKLAALARKTDRRLKSINCSDAQCTDSDAINFDYVGFSIHRQRVRPCAREVTVTSPWPNAARKRNGRTYCPAVRAIPRNCCYFLGCSPPAGAFSAAFGSGTGLSDSVCR